VTFEGDGLGELGALHGDQEDGQRLRSDQCRRDEPMPGIDRHTVGHQMEQGRGVDHVPGHETRR